MPSLARLDGPGADLAGVPRAGDDWKNSGDEDATGTAPLAPDRVLFGVA
jgi:hypothetical protein